MKHGGLKFYKACENDEPELILTYFTARLNLIAYASGNGGTCYNLKSCFGKLAANNQTDRRYGFEINDPRGCLSLSWDYTHGMNMTIIFKHQMTKITEMPTYGKFF